MLCIPSCHIAQIPIRSFDISRNQQFLAVGFDNGAIILWDLYGDSLFREYKSFSNPVTSVDLHSEVYNHVYAIDLNGYIVCWNYSNDEKVFHKRLISHPLYNSIADIDGLSIFVSGEDSLIFNLDSHSGQIKRYLYEKQCCSSIYSLELTKNGRYLLSGDRNGTLSQWDAVSGKLLKTNQSTENPITSLTSSSNAAFAIYADNLGQIFLYNIVTGKNVHYKQNEESISCLSLTTTDRGLITASVNGTIAFWNIDRYTSRLKKIDELSNAHNGYITDLMCIQVNDVEYIISSGLDGKVIICDIDYKNILTLMYFNNMTWLAYNNDGDYIGNYGVNDNSYPLMQYNNKLISNIFY